MTDAVTKNIGIEETITWALGWNEYDIDENDVLDDSIRNLFDRFNQHLQTMNGGLKNEKTALSQRGVLLCLYQKFPIIFIFNRWKEALRWSHYQKQETAPLFWAKSWKGPKIRKIFYSDQKKLGMEGWGLDDPGKFRHLVSECLHSFLGRTN